MSPARPDPRHAGRTGDPVELTRALVRVPSVNPQLSPDGTGEAEAIGLCADWLTDWGFQTEVLKTEPGRPSLVARIGDGAPRTLLCGHLDTVGTEGMEVDPFDPVIRDGRIFGRGSCDMKSGVAAILAVGRAIARKPDGFPGTLIIALTSDEEHASIGLLDLLEHGLTADRAVVTEPTSLALCPANRGFVWANLTFRGRAAHGSRPELGRDAIRSAGYVLAALDGYEAEMRRRASHPLLGGASIHAGTIQGGTTPSIYPAECTLVLEARTLPGEGPDLVTAAVRRMVERAGERDPDQDVTVQTGLSRPGAEIAADHPLVQSLSRACRDEGLEPRLAGMSAWVESAFLIEAGIPALCFGPGALEDAHTSTESVSIEEIRQATRILERWVRSAGSAESTGPADAMGSAESTGPADSTGSAESVGSVEASEADPELPSRQGDG